MAAKPSLKSVWTQFFPPKPRFTEKNIPDDLTGKVSVVTGASSGMGKELSRVLYARNAKVYVACRSEPKANQAIAEIKKAAPQSKGELIFLELDLADLTKVKSCAEAFLARESKLHVLFNNAGVMVGPARPIPRTVQGYELALGVNCVGTFLLTKLLTPTLVATAKAEPPNTVRIVWPSSFGLLQFAPPERGVDMDNLDFHKPEDAITRYGISKCGVWLLAVECARRYKADGIVSVPMNPGNVQTSLARDQTIVIPWGRFAPLRADLPKATKPEDEGGNGNAVKFWEWNEEQVKDYV
ncbi:11172c2b-2db1-4dca-803f-84bab0c71b55 [Thermothielavioides terrestris]|uniref:11172c2b-2db1-4dca-803f-84bab0c71b55 n=1 Tax=Thermothielavioides terrestris TaxID=2587410 RepID=A0A446BPU8_9PEZI|nr:11172c2b-2db1-4dca-803f-84bab0c71b55 [Thermothielavioides terrestris]